MFFSNAVFVSFLRKESFEVAPWQTYKPHYLLLSVVKKKKGGGGLPNGVAAMPTKVTFKSPKA